MKAAPAWPTEAALCSWLAGIARAAGWTVYSECGGWDMLLVRGDGLQVGIEAKLRAGLDVLRQVAGRIAPWVRQGPDYAAVLVPDAEPLGHVPLLMGVTALAPQHPGGDSWTWRYARRCLDAGDAACGEEAVLDARRETRWTGVGDLPPRLYPQLPGGSDDARWRRRTFERRCWVPPVAPDILAGAPSPSVLSPQTVGLVRVSLLLRERGWITSADLKANAQHLSFWSHRLVPIGKEGRLTRYALARGHVYPDERHPELAAALKAEAERGKESQKNLAATP